MKRLLLILSLTFALSASASEIDLEKFAQTYFNTMVATQAPNATKEDLEKYFSPHNAATGCQKLTNFLPLEYMKST